MQQILKLTLSTSAIACLPLLSTLSTSARPYPDVLGICYRFADQELTLRQPCVISSGYGAGAQYTVLHWLDHSETVISMINSCEPDAFDEAGFCRYAVDDRAASFYMRDVFLNATSILEEANLTCYEVIETSDSVCYRLN